MAHAPENTLASFRRAWEEGADGIELDVHMTRDRRIVVHHDADAQRTAGCPARLEALSLAETAALDVGAWKGSEWRGERIPTLDSVVRETPLERLIIVEVKCGAEIVPALSACRQAGLLRPEQVWFVGFNAAVMAAVKRAFPTFVVLLNVEPEDYEQQAGAAERWASQVRADRLDGIGAGMRRPDWKALQYWKQCGLALFAWVVRERDTARWLRDLQVDAAAADCPAVLRGWLSDERRQ
jgi:glycerophosphoryl diester phosphodiesterase